MEIVVVPFNYGLEDYSLKNNVNAVGIEEMSVTYTQPADTCSHQDEIQLITIKTQMADAVAEGEEGFYFDVSIPEGQHWSVDDGEELKALVDDFKKRLYARQSIPHKSKENNHERPKTDLQGT